MVKTFMLNVFTSLRTVGIAAGLSFMVMAANGLPAQAATATEIPAVDRPEHDTQLYLGGDHAAAQAENTFFAYTDEGQTLDVDFTRANPAEETADATLRITAPDASTPPSCSLMRSDMPGRTCHYADLSSDEPGVWIIDYQANGEGYGTPAYWDIRVRDSDTDADIPGQVWTEVYRVHQNVGEDADLAFFYQSQLGYQYKVTYGGYNGQWSQFEASAAGLTENGDCLPINRSATMSDEYSVEPAKCGAYKLFFAQPAASLPESVPMPDGSRSWLLSPVVAPELGRPSFAPTKKHEVAGIFSVPVTNHNGTVRLRLDINRNGQFDDDVDRTITQAVASAGEGTISIRWDGRNGKGRLAQRGAKLTALADLDHAGAIYLVHSDVEGRSGGVEVEYRNGPQAGDHTIYWNDAFDETGQFDAADASGAADIPDEADSPSAVSADSTIQQVDSTGGARSWRYGEYSWGDNRRIQDWAYINTQVASPAGEITLPARAPKVDKFAGVRSSGLFPIAGLQWVVAFGGLATAAALAFLVVLARRDRGRSIKAR
jgi:hypothetical protein